MAFQHLLDFLSYSKVLHLVKKEEKTKRRVGEGKKERRLGEGWGRKERKRGI